MIIFQIAHIETLPIFSTVGSIIQTNEEQVQSELFLLSLALVSLSSKQALSPSARRAVD